MPDVRTGLGAGEAHRRIEAEVANYVTGFCFYQSPEDGSWKYTSINGTDRLALLKYMRWEKVWPEKIEKMRWITSMFRSFYDLFKNHINIWSVDNEPSEERARRAK